MRVLRHLATGDTLSRGMSVLAEERATSEQTGRKSTKSKVNMVVERG